MRRLLLLFFLVVLTSLSVFAEGILPPFDKEKASYVINSEIDLEGQTIRLPKGATLKFRKKGLLKNGIIVGNDSRLSANKKNTGIFRDLTIEGTWQVPKVYSNWLVLSETDNNTMQFKNMFALCSDGVSNEVFIVSGTYNIDGYDSERKTPFVIRIPSHTRVHNKSTIKILPTSSAQSFPLYFSGVSDCLWEGGVIEGDLKTHIGETGEQGFGLSLRGSKNITIRNVECRDCWGDGINLQYGGAGKHNENIVIEKILCNRNRRQGVSIEDGINVTIRNSAFRNTGSELGHAPMFGIDIEPCYDEAQIRHILISDCFFDSNKGGGLNCSFLKPSDEDIRILNCRDENGGLRFNDCKIDRTSIGISVSGYQCEQGKLRFKRDVQNIAITNCAFMSALNETSNEDTISGLRVNNVRFITEEPRTWNFYCLSLICAKLEDVLFEDCTFEIKKGSALSAVFPTGGDWTGAVVKNCTIIENRDNSVFIPCDVLCSQFFVQRGLSFVNHKKRGALQFVDNEVTISNPVEKSPFILMSSPVQDYVLQNNTIYYSGSIDEVNLIVRHQKNKVKPNVSGSGNTIKQR